MLGTKIMQRKVKILAVFSMIEKAREFNWYARYIDKDKFEVTAVFLNPAEPEIIEEFRKQRLATKHIPYRGKGDVVRVIIRLFRLFLTLRPDVVHAQLFDASFAAMFAAKLAGIKNRIHTRHHGNLHHDYFPATVKYDKKINRWSKRIIVPSETVYRILTEKENVLPEKIALIFHGFDFEELIKTNETAIKTIKEKYNIHGFPVIGAVSRFTEWKGLHFTIRAFRKVLSAFPDAMLVLTNEGGDYKAQIEEELKSIPAENLRVISFEKEMPALFKTFDIFVHVPVNEQAESFGQVYIEALALGVPSVFTKSGIACEIEPLDSYTSIVPYADADSIEKAILSFAKNPEEFRKKADAGKQFVINRFSFAEKIKKTEELYLALVNG